MNDLAEALDLGANIVRVEFNQQPDRYYWSHGTHARSSNDHYGASFNSADEAAANFLESREGVRARELRAKFPQAHRASS